MASARGASKNDGSGELAASSDPGSVQIATMCAAYMPVVCRHDDAEEAQEGAQVCGVGGDELWTGDRLRNGLQNGVRVRRILRKALAQFELTLCSLYCAARHARLGHVGATAGVSPEALTEWRTVVRCGDAFAGWVTAACCTAAFRRTGTGQAAALAVAHARQRNEFYRAFAKSRDLYDGADRLTLDAMSALWSKVECLAWVCVNALASVTLT